MHTTEARRELEELCENITNKIREMNSMFRTDGARLTNTDAEYLENLTCSLVNVKKAMSYLDKEEYEEAYGARRRSAMTGRFMDNYPEYEYGNDAPRGGRYMDNDPEKTERMRAIMRSTTDERTREDIRRLLEH